MYFIGFNFNIEGIIHYFIDSALMIIERLKFNVIKIILLKLCFNFYLDLIIDVADFCFVQARYLTRKSNVGCRVSGVEDTSTC